MTHYGTMLLAAYLLAAGTLAACAYSPIWPPPRQGQFSGGARAIHPDFTIIAAAGHAGRSATLSDAIDRYLGLVLRLRGGVNGGSTPTDAVDAVQAPALRRLVITLQTNDE